MQIVPHPIPFGPPCSHRKSIASLDPSAPDLSVFATWKINDGFMGTP